MMQALRDEGIRCVAFDRDAAALDRVRTDFGDGVAFNVLAPGGGADTPFVPAASGIPRERMLKPGVMGPPLWWMVCRAPKDFAGIRNAGQDWDASLEEAEAARQAARPAAWPERAPTPAWSTE